MRIAVVFLLFLSFGCSLVPSSFVSIQDVDPSIVLEIRYYGDYNFIGERVSGYEAPRCFLTRQAAERLAVVQADLKKRGLSLKVYDCYRPQRAVDHFVKWAKDLSDVRMKKVFYPHVAKKNLFKNGYIASKSGHSRGSTVDLTIDGLDMGTPFDYFSPLSNTEDARVGKKALANRRVLKSVMEKHGFKNYDKEWWHYTLKNEPFPGQYFDFVVK